jgi:1-phosphofructokinase family hexose kinase
VILCVAANPSIDRLFTVERLVLGDIHRPAEFVQVAGGKGLNVARAATALGGDAESVALLGGHAGRWIAQELEAEGIRLHVSPAAAETRSSLSVAGAVEGLTEFYEHGFPVDPGEWTAFVRLVTQLAPRATLMTLSGSLPSGAPDDGYLGLVKLTRVAWDTRAAGIDAGPAIVKLNEHEAELATGIGTADATGAEAAARALHERSGGATVVTRGRAGAIMVTETGQTLEGRLDVRGEYPVGSGDAFLGGLVVALDRGASWPEALRAGLGAGAANAEVPGAGRLDRQRAERLAELATVAARA